MAVKKDVNRKVVELQHTACRKCIEETPYLPLVCSEKDRLSRGEAEGTKAMLAFSSSHPHHIDPEVGTLVCQSAFYHYFMPD